MRIGRMQFTVTRTYGVRNNVLFERFPRGTLRSIKKKCYISQLSPGRGTEGV